MRGPKSPIYRFQLLPTKRPGSARYTRMEIRKEFSLSFRKVSKRSKCPALLLPVRERQTVLNLKNFSRSFGKVSNIFTCPPLLSPVLDRQAICHFHTCNLTLTMGSLGKLFCSFNFQYVLKNKSTYTRISYPPHLFPDGIIKKRTCMIQILQKKNKSYYFKIEKITDGLRFPKFLF